MQAQLEGLKPLLALIRKLEAGATGYEAYNRGRAGDSPGAFPGGLLLMTVGEVQKAQRDELLFAAGGYQFTPDPLKEVVAEAKMALTERFNAGTQDLLAAQLILGRKRPALRDYLLGKSGDVDKAMLDLAREWASFPMANGKGVYDGDSAGNKAHVSVATVKKVLAEVREALAKPAAPEETILYFIEAVKPTLLKKEPKQGVELAEDQKVSVPAGRRYGVVKREEQHDDAHAKVTLASGAGEWYVFEPHWKRPGTSGPVQDLPVDWDDFSCLVHPYLTVGEVLQWDRRRRPQGGREVREIMATAEQHLMIRAAIGVPLGVTSFYRPEPINREVGGVPGSFHVPGQAMDVYVPGRSIDWLYQHMSRRWTGGLGDGRARGFIHLDRRGGGRYVPGGGVWPAEVFGY